ncbi:hypothetical protein [Cellulomonas soli]
MRRTSTFRALATLALTASLMGGAATVASAAVDPIPPVTGTLPSISVGGFSTLARCNQVRAVYTPDYSVVSACTKRVGQTSWFFSYRPASAR